MLTIIIAMLGVVVWMVTDIGFQTFGYVIGDTDAE